MHYWNRDNFEGLRRVAAALRTHEELAGLADYCTLREQGLRGQALKALDRFLSEASRWDPVTARDHALRILELHLKAPGVHQFVTDPLQRRFLVPVLRRWRQEATAPPAALRWLGVLTRDRALVAEALKLDPTDGLSRRHLLEAHLDDAEHSMHYLDESRFIGSEADTAASLRRARALLADAPDPAELAHLAEEASHLEQMLVDWLEFRSARGQSFPDWCRARGRRYGWPSRCYYDSRRASSDEE